MTYTPSPHHEHEERERVEETRREREERRERVTPPTDGSWSRWWDDRRRRYEELLRTIDPNHDKSHLNSILGVHDHWNGPIADAFKAFVRQLLADVEERDREAREKLKLISQEKFSPTPNT